MQVVVKRKTEGREASRGHARAGFIHINLSVMFIGPLSVSVECSSLEQAVFVFIEQSPPPVMLAHKGGGTTLLVA